MVRAMPVVIAVRHVRDRVLHVAFDDGVAGEVDLDGQLDGPAFAAVMADDARFAQVYVDQEAGTVNWPPGNLDLAPEALHDEIERRQTPREGSPVIGPSE